MCFVNLPHSPPCAGALHDFDVKRAVCKNIEHEPVSYLVVWMTTDLGPISHASVDNGDGRCRQQQQPDGHRVGMDGCSDMAKLRCLANENVTAM